MNRRSSLKTTSPAQRVQPGPTFRRPKIVLPIPTPTSKFQHVEDGVPDTQLTREATGLLREFSTPLLFNHSHRVFFWAEYFDVELLFICAAFHDLGLKPCPIKFVDSFGSAKFVLVGFPSSPPFAQSGAPINQNPQEQNSDPQIR
jgi:hypothetical protein